MEWFVVIMVGLVLFGYFMTSRSPLSSEVDSIEQPEEGIVVLPPNQVNVSKPVKNRTSQGDGNAPLKWKLERRPAPSSQSATKGASNHAKDARQSATNPRLKAFGE